MAAVTKVFPGAYRFEPETDPEKIKQHADNFAAWKELFDQVVHTRDEHGWESPECQYARMELHKWQMKRRREKIDQADSE
jgi:hypothetical protein